MAMDHLAQGVGRARSPERQVARVTEELAAGGLVAVGEDLGETLSAVLPHALVFGSTKAIPEHLWTAPFRHRVVPKQLGAYEEKEWRMAEQDVENLRGAYDRFNAGDPQAVLGLMAEDVEWNEPGGGNAASGTFNGPQSVSEDVFSTIPANFDEFSVNPENFDDQGETVIITGRFKGKAKSGADLDAPFEHVWELEDGKVKRFNNNVDQDAWTAAWS